MSALPEDAMLHKVSTVARKLDLSVWQVYSLIGSKRLRAVRPTPRGALHVLDEDLRQYVASLVAVNAAKRGEGKR